MTPRTITLACVVILLAAVAAPAPAQLTFSCKSDNDLYRALQTANPPPPRLDTPAAAIGGAPAGSGVLILADGYPTTRAALLAADYDRAKAKHLRLFIEYPDALPGVTFGQAKTAAWERGVAASDAFGPALPKLRIVGLHACQYLPVQGDAAPLKPDLVLARVAGYDTAVYGLATDSGPLLFGIDDGRVLVAATSLSRFVTARYEPAADWLVIWRTILKRLDPNHEPPALKVDPLVRPALPKDAPAPPTFQRETFDRAAAFYTHARLLIPKDRQVEIHRLLRAGTETTDPPATDVEGDGALGMLEGYSSLIRPDGSQPQRTPIRSDCNAEAAMILALDAMLRSGDTRAQSQAPSLRYSGERAGERGEVRPATNTGRSVGPRGATNPAPAGATRPQPLSPTLSPAYRAEGAKSALVAANLLDYVFGPEMESLGRSDPRHPAFGLIAWGAISPTWQIGNYGDDDARVLLSTILASAALKSDKWDLNLCRALLANLRTTGSKGFRGDRVDIGPLEAQGWKAFHDASPVNPAPHFESYLWACYLWAHRATAEPEFLDKTTTAIRLTMDAYAKQQWRWMDNIERSRMLLCLAWLVRVQDTPEHRAWLTTIATDLLAAQQPCGAIQELRGAPGGGHYQIPQSNEAYGTGETPLIQTNGDPASDQLYTTGFALLGLHEAAAATGDAKLKQAEDKLADYLCRIQVRSEALPYLDGGWFRAFDYRRWDYWASNADLGWGVWCVEAGWGQAWTAATLALREQHTTLWDMTATSGMKSQLNRVRQEMAQNAGGPWKR